MSPQERVLHLPHSIHYILDACFWLGLEKVDDSLEKVVNRIIKYRIEGTYGGERIGCLMLDCNFPIFARGNTNLFNEID